MVLGVFHKNLAKTPCQTQHPPVIIELRFGLRGEKPKTQKEIAIWFGYIMSGIFILSMIIGVVCLTTIIFRWCVKVFKANKSTIALCGFLLLAILLLVFFVLGLLEKSTAPYCVVIYIISAIIFSIHRYNKNHNP